MLYGIYLMIIDLRTLRRLVDYIHIYVFYCGRALCSGICSDSPFVNYQLTAYLRSVLNARAACHCCGWLLYLIRYRVMLSIG